MLHVDTWCNRMSVILFTNSMNSIWYVLCLVSSLAKEYHQVIWEHFLLWIHRENNEKEKFFFYISQHDIWSDCWLIEFIFVFFFFLYFVYIYIYTYINPISLVLFNNGIDNQLNYMFNIRIVFLSSHRRPRYVDNWWFCLRKWRFFSSSSLHTGCL